MIQFGEGLKNKFFGKFLEIAQILVEDIYILLKNQFLVRGQNILWKQLIFLINVVKEMRFNVQKIDIVSIFQFVKSLFRDLSLRLEIDGLKWEVF